MAKYVGIDIGATAVKIAVIRGAARKWVIEELMLLDRLPPNTSAFDEAGLSAGAPTLEALLSEAKNLASGGEPLSVGLDGDRTYVRTVEIPSAVRRRLLEVLPFELEAQLPFDLEDAVWAERVRAGVPFEKPQPVLVAAARIDDVKAQIDLVERAIGRPPDHVAPGAFPLADLVFSLPSFRASSSATGPVRAILDLGHESSEILVLSGSEPLYVRTLSRGTAGMPQQAGNLAREIRQTIAAFRAAGGESPESVLLTGGGALIGDMARWLAAELQLPVEPLEITLEGAEKRPDIHRFSRAIGIALTGAPRRRGVDLRRGPLAFERGFGWLAARAPLLSALGATILVSFIFATWARARTLSADRKALDTALAQTTDEVLGEATTDLDRVAELLTKKGAGGGDDDPMPRADAMDVLVQLSELIPTDKMKHDIEKLDMQRLPAGGFRVVIAGVAPTTADVQTVESVLHAYRCFSNPTVTKKTKAIADDRQKYTLETELRCPEEGGGGKKPAGAAAPTGSR